VKHGISDTSEFTAWGGLKKWGLQAHSQEWLCHGLPSFRVWCG
jgi:hypothetical protein